MEEVQEYLETSEAFNKAVLADCKDVADQAFDDVFLMTAIRWIVGREFARLKEDEFDVEKRRLLEEFVKNGQSVIRNRVGLVESVERRIAKAFTANRMKIERFDIESIKSTFMRLLREHRERAEALIDVARNDPKPPS